MIIKIILSLFVLATSGAEVQGYIGTVRDFEYKEICISTECRTIRKVPLDPYYRKPKLPKTVIL